MARNWQYPRWRRVAMQGVMCLVLAGSVGLAAYVGHQRRPPVVTLGPAEVHGRLSFGVPVGWDVQEKILDARHSFIARDKQAGRLLRIDQMPAGLRADPNSLLAEELRQPIDEA